MKAEVINNEVIRVPFIGAGKGGVLLELEDIENILGQV